MYGYASLVLRLRSKSFQALGALVIASVFLNPAAASAQFYVRQPEVEKGELEIEEHGTFYSGLSDAEESPLRQSHEVEATYGLTNFLLIIAEGVFEDPEGEDFKASEAEFGGQVELIELHENGLGLAFRGLYEAALVSGEPDAIVFGPVIKLVNGRFANVLNTFFVDQVGSDAEVDGLGLEYAYQLKVALNHRFGVGLEAFGEIEDLGHSGSFDDQEHRLGPVIYIDLGSEEDASVIRDDDEHDKSKPEAPEVKLAAGILFGLTEATSDLAFKVDLEVEF